MSNQTQGLPDKLVDLALLKFPDLTAPEKAMLDSAQKGEWLNLPAPPETTEESQPPKVDEARMIRAEVIRWLCADTNAAGKVDTRGIKLGRAFVKGTLDLSYTKVPFALEFEKSDFPAALDFKSAQLTDLTLRGCKVGRIWAIHLVVAGDVSLNYGFRSEGSVIFDRCRIGGNFDCRQGTFSATDATALSLYSGRIEGSVMLSDGFSASNEVYLGSASIQGNLTCSGGRISIAVEQDTKESAGLVESKQTPETPGIRGQVESEKKAAKVQKAALQASGLRIAGSAFLRDGLEIRGETVLIGANIGGDLDCNGASFLNSGKPALIADRIKVGGDAFFLGRCQTDGLIVLTSATIEGNLFFNGTRFVGDARCGVILEVASVKRTLVWRNIEKTPRMILNLDDASVGRLLDDEQSWPAEDNLSLFGFTYGRISGVKTRKGRIGWVQLSKKGQSLQPYAQLAAVFKYSGHENDAKKVAIAREDARRRHSGLGRWLRLWKGILKVTVGYGYAPTRALYWALGVIVFGWLVFGAAYRSALFSPVSEGVYRDPAYIETGQTPNGYQTFNAFVYSVDSFLPIIDLHQESKWLPNPTRKSKFAGREIAGGMLTRIYLWIHIVAGWALTTLTVAGFTGVIRKE
jgi:hypothetical protein